MDKEISELICVEYSPSQKCFHVETVGEMLIDGYRMMNGKGYTDFYPIRIFRRDAEARTFLDRLYARMKFDDGMIL